jgi:hypothetical protein
MAQPAGQELLVPQGLWAQSVQLEQQALLVKRV